jgi:amino-acid N-acetyltransferase
MDAMTSPDAVAYRRAAPADLEEIERLLRASALPTAGVRESLDAFLVAEAEGQLVGAIGMETHDDYGLLRSAAVDVRRRGSGVGRALVERIVEEARSRRMVALYLLTTTAEEYFPRFGFERTTRDVVPDAVKRSVEFRGACPDTAVVMRRRL